MSASVSSRSTEGAAPSAVARKTMPQPVLSAPRTTIWGAPVVPREPATTSRAPAEYLWAGSAVRGILPLSESASVHTSEESTSASGGMPMSTAATSPARSRPGEITHPTFTACAQTVTSARTAAPCTSPVAPSTPEGTSTASTAAEEPLIPSMSRASLSHLPREACPEQGVYNQVRPIQLRFKLVGANEPHAEVAQYGQVRGGVAFVLVLRRQDRDIDPGPVQLASHHEAVTAVVTSAGYHEHPLRRVDFQGDAGHLGPCALHEDAAWDSELLGTLVRAGHLLGGVEPHCMPRTTQTATAESSEWVMEIKRSSCLTPTMSANRSILPKIRTVGA